MSKPIFGPKTLKSLRRFAAEGNVEIQHLVGVGYSDGSHGAIDFVQAHKWLLSAAKQGLAVAQLDLSLLLLEDHIGLPKDYETSFHWAKAAADQDLPGAINLLGCMYALGYGTEIDPERSFKCFEKAAYMVCETMYEQGNALCNLGLSYVRGFGTERDVVQGLEILRFAEAHGFPAASYEIAGRYLRGVGGIEKDVDEATAHLVKASEAGFMPARTRLIDLHNNQTMIKRYYGSAKL